MPKKSVYDASVDDKPQLNEILFAKCYAVEKVRAVCGRL